MGWIIIFIIWALVLIFLPQITQWFRRMLARRAEDMLRRAMGMPGRKEENRARRKQEKQNKNRKKSAPDRHAHQNPAQSMQKVAEDVEFTEIREYSSSTVIDDPQTNTRTIVEEQITDAEFIEIKTGTGKQTGETAAKKESEK